MKPETAKTYVFGTICIYGKSLILSIFLCILHLNQTEASLPVDSSFNSLHSVFSEQEIYNPIHPYAFSMVLLPEQVSSFLDINQSPNKRLSTSSKSRDFLPPYYRISSFTEDACILSILHRIQENRSANPFLKLLLDIFGNGNHINLSIGTADLNSHIDDSFTYQNSIDTSFEIFYFQGQITLNTDYTSTVSRDWLLATIIHEMIHAYIAIYVERKNAGLISELEFINKFPLYFQIPSNRDHHEMAGNYVEVISSVLQDFNPNLGIEEEEALAWVGLHGTKAWMALDDANLIYGVNRVGKGEIPAPKTSDQVWCH